MPVVTNTVKYPNGTVAAGRVSIDLVGTNGQPLTSGAFVTASDYTIEATYSADLAAGVWSVTLPANSLINPAGTRWRVKESIGGRDTTYYVDVPNGAGPYFVEDILDEAPGTIVSAVRPTEQVSTVAASGAALTLVEPGVATIHDVTLTANCTLTFPALAVGVGFTLVLRQDGTGSRLVTWPAAVDSPGGVAPTLSTGANAVDVLSFLSPDGVAWLGFVGGQNFS